MKDAFQNYHKDAPPPQKKKISINQKIKQSSSVDRKTPETFTSLSKIHRSVAKGGSRGMLKKKSVLFTVVKGL